jgi:hypothetical protein
MTGIFVHGAGALAPAPLASYSAASPTDAQDSLASPAAPLTAEAASTPDDEDSANPAEELAERVEIPEKRTVDSQTFRNPDGSYTTEYSTGPIFYDPGDGTLQPIDVSPVASEADGAAFETKAAPVVSRLGDASAGELLTVQSRGHSITFRPTLPPLRDGAAAAASKAPAVEDGQVIYRDVYPNVDLRYTLLPNGAKEDIVLTAPGALYRFAFIVDAPGLSATLNDDGSIDVGTRKEAIFHLPAPFMVDSTPEDDGDGVRSTDVRYELLTVAGATVLVVEADPDWLADPKRVYPVYIDPTTTTSYTATSDTFISSAYPSYSLDDQWNPNEGGYYELWNGRYDATSGTNYAFVKTGIPTGVSVTSATLNVYVQHAYSGGTATGIQLGRLTSAFTESQTWNMTHPSYVALTSDTVADNQWATFNVTSTVRSWVEGTATNHGFRIYQSSTSQSLWKRLRARENSTNRPYLSVTYTNPVASVVSPTGGAWTNSSALDWNFSANGSSFSQTKFHAQVSTSSTTWSGTALKANSGEVSSSATAWTAPTTNLVNGTTYYWRVKVFDGHSWSAWTTAASFKWDAAAPTPPPAGQQLVTVAGAITPPDPAPPATVDFYDLGNGTFTVRIRGTDTHSGIKLTYLRLFNATDEMRVSHDWSSSNTTNCNEFNTSTLVDATACSRTYNTSGTREVQFTVVGLNQNASFDIQYYFTDHAGNTVGYTDTGKNLIFDATAPTGSIAQPAAGATVTGIVPITGTASDTNFLQYELHYGAGPSPSQWFDVGQNPRLTSVTNGTLASWDTAGLAVGTYTLRLRVYDKARVSSGMTTVTRTVTVDPGPPTAVITSPADDDFVAGQVDVSGTASAATDFEDYTLHYGEGCSPTVWLDIGANPRTAPVTDGLLGSWDASGVSGEHAIRLVVSKTDDTTSTSTICVTADNEPPAVPSVTVTGDLVYQSEPNAPAYFGADADLLVNASSTAGESGIAAIRFGALSAPSGWTAAPALPVKDQEAPYEVVLTPSASAGDTSLVVAATSGAGVVSSDASIQLVRDGTPPTASFSSPAGLAVSNAATTQVAWSATDAGSGVALQTVQRQEADVVFAGSCTGAEWEDIGEPLAAPGPLTEPLDDGMCHRWVLTVSDHVGNTLTVVSNAILGDRTGPALDFQTPNESTSAASAAASVTVEWTASDGASDVASVELTREVADKVNGSCIGASWGADVVESATASPAHVVGLEADRCYRWVLESIDGAGNASTRTSGVIALDRVVLAAPPAQALFFDIEQLEVVAGDPGPTSVEFLVDGQVIATDSSAPFGTGWDTTTSADGLVTLVLRANFASGPAFESSPINVTVANQLAPEERVEADAWAGRITIDERALRMAYAVGGSGWLPSRYHGPLEGDGHASVSLQFLRDWDQLAPATKAEIEAFLNQPWRGDFYATPGGSNRGVVNPNFPECVEILVNRNGGTITYCVHDTAGGTFSIKYYLEGDYRGGVALVDANSNGVPDYIDRIAVALEDAWDEYTALDYASATSASDRIPVLIHALSVGGQVTPGIDPVIEIDNDQVNQREVYLARHELFHFMQYGYVDLVDLAASYQEQWFWMEATAEWAAHQAQLAGSQQVALNEYYQDIGDYLGRPHLEFDHCECDAGSGIPITSQLFAQDLRDREYGAFVFAEFLEERFNDRDVIRETWDAIAQNQMADEAIDDVAAVENTTLRALLTEFAQTVYLMQFVTPERSDWKGRLQDFGDETPNEYTGADEYGGPRPARTLVTMLDGPVEEGELTLEEGGFSYIEMAPIESGLGQIDVSVSRESESIDATLLLLDKSAVAGPLGYPAVCDEVSLTFEDGFAQQTVPVNDGCATHAVLMLVHGEPINGQPAAVSWTATFDSGLVSNGTIQLGLNPHGHLIAEGSTPSSSGTLEVGLRYLSTQDEGLSHGCFCEGWGVADVTTNTSGWANEDWGGTGGIELIEFDKIFDTALSRVRVSDKLEVTHDVRPADGTQFLYEFEVSIRNISSQPTDIRYRRTIDWDIDPDPLSENRTAPFREYVTIDAFGGQPVPVLAFSSNDGFADPDPLAGPTDDGEVGFFTDAGPYDHGALFDFDFGSLAPGASRTFYLYYGAAPSRGDALTALGIVGAHVYSFGQTYNVDMSVNNSGTTFIFAFRDSEAAGESLLGSAQATPEVVSAPSAGNRNEQ